MNNLKNKLAQIMLESISDETTFIFENAVKDLVKAHNKLQRKEEPNYDGYDLTESELTACCFPISENLTLESVEYAKERDRGLLNHIICCAVQIGMNEGLKTGKRKGRGNLAMELLNIVRND